MYKFYLSEFGETNYRMRFLVMDTVLPHYFLDDDDDEQFEELLRLSSPKVLIKSSDDFIYRQLEATCIDLLRNFSDVNSDNNETFNVSDAAYKIEPPISTEKKSIGKKSLISSRMKRKKVQFGPTSSNEASSEFLDSDVEDEQIQKFLRSRKKRKLNMKLHNPMPDRRATLMELRALNHFGDKPDDEFFHYLRVTKETYQFILDKIKEASIFTGNHAGGNVPIQAEQALQMFLYYMGHRCTYKLLSQMYHISESAIMSSFMKCVEGINRLDDKEVRWPSSHSELKAIQNGFKAIAGLPGVIGSIGGCCAEMRTNKEPPAGYKIGKLRSIMYLLGVTDAQCRFIYIQAGFPGTFSLQEAFESSSLGEMMKANSSSLFLDSSTHLIANGEFSLHKHLIVPYPSTTGLTDVQANLNIKIAESNVCQKAFSRLKSRFTSLQTQVYANLEKIPNIIKACCIVHNIALKDPGDEELLSKDLTDISEDYSSFRDDSDFIPSKPDKEAFMKRDSIAKKVYKT